MRRPTTLGRGAAALAASLLLAPLPAGCDGAGGASADVTEGDAGAACEPDDSDEPAGAAPLASGATASDLLCPVKDADWYRYETGASDHLLTISLAMDGPLSPVEPAYILWSVDTYGAPDAVVATPPAELLGQPLDQVHCVAPGRYLVSIRDDGDDAQDFRRAYVLTMTSAPDPDPAEPNDDASAAHALADGAAATGAISCRGDEDWFTVEVPAGRRIRLTLTAPVAAFEPTLRLLDPAGQPVGVQSNPSARVSETDLELSLLLTTPGTYHAVVADDDGRHADPEAPYTLAYQTFADTDPNEPNPHPDLATPLTAAAAPCGDDWGEWLEATGTIGAPGDSDWFRLPLSGCAPQGVLEAQVVLDDGGLDAAQRWALSRQVQLALTVVRAHPTSPCVADGECQALTKTCGSSWDCSGLFNACLPDGLCAGAAVCLPEGSCGANAIERHYNAPAVPADTSTPPPANRADLTTPLFGDDVLYLRVGDYQADGADGGVSYRLRARVRRDPDVHEPSNVYEPNLLSTFPPSIQAAAAEPISVHDCTGEAPDCCGPDTWIEGVISYENDMDWYRYAHPCPGQDCNLRIRYEMDPGPVDYVLSVYRRSTLWFGGVAGATAELPAQPAMAGSFGGDSVGDACFYAFAGHEGEPYYYHVALRDLAEVRDFDVDQRYRFCVEKVSNACDAPCRLWPDGCGQP